MLHLNELIVYLWIFPVAFQIFLPLAVLGFWLVSRIPASLGKTSSSKMGVAEPTTAS